MRLPEILLSLMKSAALTSGVALSAGCLASASPSAMTPTYIDPSQPNVVYLVEDPSNPQPQPMVVQQPCVYVPSQQPAVTVQPVPTTSQPSAVDPDPCLGCGMG